VELDDLYHTFTGTRRDTTYRAPIPQRNHMVEPSGQVEHHKRQSGPAHEVETLLSALADEGRDLGPDLAHHLRERLAPLSRQVRAELVAVIDDAFEVAPDLTTARRQAHQLLSDAKALEAAKAVWPAYPEPPAQQWPGKI